MERKRDAAEPSNPAHQDAEREQQATKHLLGLGAGDLDARPWRPEPAPPTAVDLAHFALWRSAELAPDAVISALTLLPAARAEVDGLESGLLFAARSAGLTWSQIAEAMGFNSKQACQQHYARLTTRDSADS